MQHSQKCSTFALAKTKDRLLPLNLTQPIMIYQTISTWMTNAQETILRIFTEGSSYSPSHADDYCLRAHCGAYQRMRM